MRQIPILLVGALLGAGQYAGPAQSTINFAAAPGQRDVRYGPGTPLPDGNYVQIGFFNSSFNITDNANNPGGLSGAWNPLGFTEVQTLFGEPGRFADTLYTSDPLFDNRKIWLWIFRTLDAAIPDLQFDNVTDYGLYSSSAANWYFPPQGADPLASVVNIHSSEVDQAWYGAYDANHLLLTTVPEPSTWTLSAIGLGLLGLRFRRGRRG